MLSIEQIAFLACELMHFSPCSLHFLPFFPSFLSFFSLWSLNKISSLQNVLLNKWVVILYLSFHHFLSVRACCTSETFFDLERKKLDRQIMFLQGKLHYNAKKFKCVSQGWMEDINRLINTSYTVGKLTCFAPSWHFTVSLHVQT